MKIKIDFITNSSSASFTIPLTCVSQKQIDMIINHIELAAAVQEEYSKDHQYALYLDEWTIEIKEHLVDGYTSMDNFDMEWFLNNVVKVHPDCVHWEGSNY